MLQEMFDELNKFLIAVPPKVELSKINEKEKELGLIMPESMKDFYEYYGNDSSIFNAFYIFDKLDNICIEKNALTFGYTHQKINRLGITLEKLNSKFQSISFFSEELNNWFSEGAVFPESFFFNIAGWHVLNLLPAIAKVELKNDEFEKLCQKNIQFFNIDKKYVRGFKIITCKCNEILGCYLREDEELYLGAQEDELLENLEKELKMDFDWL